MSKILIKLPDDSSICWHCLLLWVWSPVCFYDNLANISTRLTSPCLQDIERSRPLFFLLFVTFLVKATGLPLMSTTNIVEFSISLLSNCPIFFMMAIYYAWDQCDWNQRRVLESLLVSASMPTKSPVPTKQQNGWCVSVTLGSVSWMSQYLF